MATKRQRNVVADKSSSSIYFSAFQCAQNESVARFFRSRGVRQVTRPYYVIAICFIPPLVTGISAFASQWNQPGPGRFGKTACLALVCILYLKAISDLAAFVVPFTANGLASFR